MAVTFLDPGTSATFDLSFYTTFTSNGQIASLPLNTHGQQRSLRSVANVGGVSRSGLAFTAFNCLGASNRISFYFQLDAYPTTWASADTTKSDLIVAAINGGSTYWRVGIDATGLLHIMDTTGTTQAIGTHVLALNTLYRISIAYTGNGNTQINVYVNGVLECSKASMGAAYNGVKLQLGLSAWDATGSAANAYYTDIYVDDSSALTDPGDIRVTAKRPFANGTTNGFSTQIGAGGSSYGTGHAPQVNERALSQTNGWAMVGAGAAVTEEYSIEGLAVGDIDLTGKTLIDYMGWAFAKALAGETAQIIVGGAASGITLTTSAAMYAKAKGSTTYPAGLTDIGLITATDLTTVSLYECGVVIAYTSASPTGGAMALMGVG